ncbi:MAG: recombinase family protein, partial [Phycisphaerae bacterium]
MVLQFKEVFLGGNLPLFDTVASQGTWVSLAVAYLRYSHKEQNARSFDDQLYLALINAKKHGVFIPWCYVCADAGVTATISNRTGYKLVKNILARKGVGEVTTVFIDEIDRASREGIETLQLGKLVTSLGKRLIGVSCGYDSNDPSAKTKLYFYAMFNEEYVSQLKTKVTRGKQGTARRGTSLAKPPFGLKLTPASDANGNPIYGSKGKRLNKWTRDENFVWALELLAKLFVDARRSIGKIAKEFNRQRIGGKVCWKSSTIRGMLRNYAYVGIMVANRIRTVRDSVTGSTTNHMSPRKEWIVRRNRDTQIWTWKRWKEIQKRLTLVHECRPGGRKPGIKNQVYPSTLFSGILCCGYDGSDLILGRGGDAINYYSCGHHPTNAYGCGLTTYRQVSRVEASILGYVRDTLLTEDRLAGLVEAANRYLAQEAARPRADTSGLQQSLKEATAKLNHLIDVAAEGMADRSAIRARIDSMTAEARALKQAIKDAESTNQEYLPPLRKENIIALLGDMRAILNQEVQIVAPLLREMLGKVSIRQHLPEGWRRHIWIANIQGNLLPLIAKAAAQAKSPDSYTLAGLLVRNWRNALAEEITIRMRIPAFETHAAEVFALSQTGLSHRKVAAKLGLSVEVVRCALLFATTGHGRLHKPKSSK